MYSKRLEIININRVQLLFALILKPICQPGDLELELSKRAGRPDSGFELFGPAHFDSST
jgi:hypothetical protein